MQPGASIVAAAQRPARRGRRCTGAALQARGARANVVPGETFGETAARCDVTYYVTLPLKSGGRNVT
jgi:hypothetical protein